VQYKNILLYLDQGASNPERVNTAVAMAEQHGAQLTGVVIHALPTSRMMHKLGLGDSDDVLKQARQEADAVLEAFSRQMTERGISFDTRTIECKESAAPKKLARMVRNFDLCILRQANPDKPNADFIAELSEGVLFYSGRPVFFMPYIGAHSIPARKGIVAWDGSAAASRAVHDSLPLLEQMESVVILVVDADKIERNDDTEPGHDLSRHLAAHGIKNEVMRVVSGGIGTSTTILNEVSNTSADILIMGGYGTAKLREMMLGGVTRTLFRTMTVPVVMSH